MLCSRGKNRDKNIKFICFHHWRVMSSLHIKYGILWVGIKLRRGRIEASHIRYRGWSSIALSACLVWDRIKFNSDNASSNATGLNPWLPARWTIPVFHSVFHSSLPLLVSGYCFLVPDLSWRERKMAADNIVFDERKAYEEKTDVQVCWLLVQNFATTSYIHFFLVEIRLSLAEL